MTSQSRATLKSKFETGDTPDGQDFADLIDSFVTLREVGTQVVDGRIEAEQVVAEEVFADRVKTKIVFIERFVTAPVAVSTSASDTWQQLPLGVTNVLSDGVSAGTTAFHLVGTDTAIFQVTGAICVSAPTATAGAVGVMVNGTIVDKTVQVGPTAGTASIPFSGTIEVSASNQVSLAIRLTGAGSFSAGIESLNWVSKVISYRDN